MALSTNRWYDWIITKEIDALQESKDVFVFPYKSCYIPNGNGTILLNFRDKQVKIDYI